MNGRPASVNDDAHNTGKAAPGLMFIASMALAGVVVEALGNQFALHADTTHQGGKELPRHCLGLQRDAVEPRSCQRVFAP